MLEIAQAATAPGRRHVAGPLRASTTSGSLPSEALRAPGQRLGQPERELIAVLTSMLHASVSTSGIAVPCPTFEVRFPPKGLGDSGSVRLPFGHFTTCLHRTSSPCCSRRSISTLPSRAAIIHHVYAHAPASAAPRCKNRVAVAEPISNHSFSLFLTTRRSLPTAQSRQRGRRSFRSSRFSTSARRPILQPVRTACVFRAGTPSHVSRHSHGACDSARTRRRYAPRPRYTLVHYGRAAA
jgi:hypothetical protein